MMIGPLVGAVLMAQTFEMGQYQLGFLKPGPNVSALSDADSMRMQRGHLGNLQWMLDRGRAVALGPVEADDMRGIIVFAEGLTAVQAKELMKDDPWIKDGRLVLELHTWYAAKNILKPRTGALTDVEPALFGMLERPANAPKLTPEESTKVQEGHMANINRMAEEGALVIAGPMVEDTPFRGIFVFRLTDDAKVKELVARDPAIAKGRLTCRLIKWWLPKGILGSK
jgi:uncharacterized protein YciI